MERNSYEMSQNNSDKAQRQTTATKGKEADRFSEPLEMERQMTASAPDEQLTEQGWLLLNRGTLKLLLLLSAARGGTLAAGVSSRSMLSTILLNAEDTYWVPRTCQAQEKIRRQIRHSLPQEI